jgi:hypothetical protein
MAKRAERDIVVSCDKTGKNTVHCVATDMDDGSYWEGTCTKDKKGNWSCVQTKAGGPSPTKLRNIPPELREALLAVEPRRK